MKIIYNILVISVFWSLKTQSQDFCGTDPNVPDYLQTISNPLRNTSGPYTIRIFAHFIRENAGTGGITTAEFNSAMQILSDDLAPHNICISLEGTDEIKDSILYVGHFLWSSTYNVAYATNPHPEAIDIYFFPNSSSAWGGRSDGIPGSAMVIGGTMPSPPPTVIINTSHVISHEFGHCLGLYHTHHQLEGSCPDCWDLTCSNCNNGNGCLTCGDYICDTHPDPNLNFVTGATGCVYFGPYNNDPCGHTMNPHTDIIMSYTHPVCMTLFTTDQGQRMRDMIANNPILQAATVPENVFVENKSYSTGNILYAAKETVTAGEDVTTGTNGPVSFTASAVGEFKAHNYVKMMHGFNASPNSSGSFHASIDPSFCSVFTPNFSRNLQLMAYNPLLNNSKWLSTLQGIEGNINEITEALIDTVISGFNYKKIISTYVYLNGITNDTAIVPGTTSGFSFWREDVFQRKVYTYYNNSDHLIFDFSLAVGSQHPVLSNYLLATIDSINTNAGYRNRFTFSDGSNQIIWVEGVGNIEMPLNNYLPYDTLALTLLICSYQNNNLVYDDGSAIPINCSTFLNIKNNTNQTDQIIISPNPTNGSILLTFDNSKFEIQSIDIVDNLGKLVLHKEQIHLSDNKINLNFLDQGIYYIKINTQINPIVRKIIIIK